MSPRNTSRPATSSRSCCHNASRRRSNCRRLRFTGRCGGSIRRPFCISSTSETSRSPARAQKSSCACATAQQDTALEVELLADEKERAEHLMLLDLGRNDVGRVARTATVKVTDQFFVERFSQVMHIVSNVEG